MLELEYVSLMIVLLPLVAALVSGLFGRLIGRIGAHTLTIGAVGLSFMLSVDVLRTLLETNETFNTTLYVWGSDTHFKFTVGFLIDRLSALMMVVVTFVSWMVHIYTVEYMKDDPGYQRFFCYIALFTFGMLMLVKRLRIIYRRYSVLPH